MKTEINSKNEKVVLRLFVMGMNQTARKAIANLEEVCEELLPGSYEIEIVDLKENPGLAADEQIFAVPTVIKKSPLPMRKVIGDLSNKEKVMVGLDLSSLK